MAVNKLAFELVGVSYEQYVSWCKENKKPINSKKSKHEFFSRIREGKLAVDFDNKLIKKRPRRN